MKVTLLSPFYWMKSASKPSPCCTTGTTLLVVSRAPRLWVRDRASSPLLPDRNELALHSPASSDSFFLFSLILTSRESWSKWICKNYCVLSSRCRSRWARHCALHYVESIHVLSRNVYSFCGILRLELSWKIMSWRHGLLGDQIGLKEEELLVYLQRLHHSFTLN